ncbi:MAG: hypothetical protein ABW215_02535 [Kibdelosporangium sp.]
MRTTASVPPSAAVQPDDAGGTSRPGFGTTCQGTGFRTTEFRTTDFRGAAGRPGLITSDAGGESRFADDTGRGLSDATITSRR